MATDALSALFDVAQVKTCTKCGETKSVSDFHSQKLGKFGVASRCKLCAQAYSAERNLATREAKKEAARAAGKVVFGDAVECVVCGSCFPRRAALHRTCDDCKSVAADEKRSRAERLNCADCGSDVERRSPSQKRCEDCATLAEKLRRARQPTVKSCLDCGLGITGSRKRCEGCQHSHRKLQDAIRQKARRSDPVLREKINARARGKPRTDANRAYVRKWEADRRKNDPKFATHARMRAMVGNAIREKKAGRSWQELVGYTSDELMASLEKQFARGMTWENRDKWQIDHVVPVSSFNFDGPDHPDFKACWALTNLRPLWTKENRAKWHHVTHFI